jgi:hypothetical protein
MARTYEAPTEITHPDENHVFPADYKDGTSFDSKISMPNLAKHFEAKNDIINGSMDFWQRFYTSKASLANGDYLADRFAYEKSGTMVHDCKREITIKPVGSNASLHLDLTTAQGTINAADYCLFTHIIEGCNINKYLINGFLCFGLWVRSPKSGIHCISFRNDGKDRSIVKEITIAAADTLEFHPVVIPFNETGGTWDYENGAGLRISFALAAGTNYHTVDDGTWKTGNYLATANQQNLCDNIANEVYFGNVSCNIGKLPVSNGLVDKALETSRVQRYYEKSLNLAIDPGAIDSKGAMVAEQATAGTFIKRQEALAVTKRTDIFTIIWYSDNSGLANNIYNNIAAADVAVNNTLFEGQHSSGIPIAAASVPVGAILSAQYAIDAEIGV